MLVLKFGGTSVGSPLAIRKLIDIVGDSEHTGRTRVVVVSAFSGITDALIEAARLAESGDGRFEEKLAAMSKRHLDAARELCAAREFRKARESGAAGTELRTACEAGVGTELAAAELAAAELAAAQEFIQISFSELARSLQGVLVLGELSSRTLDFVMSFGERLSAFIVSRAFRCTGIEADFLDSRLLLKTDDQYGSARFLPEQSYPNIRSAMETRKALQIATGFIASTADGKTTTLGRGGSDLSAAIFGAALDADEVEIWTDVDGILTADPRLVPGAFRIESISYIEAMELSHFGAKVLHPPTVRPALEKGIPIRIRNTFNPACAGTLISSSASESPYPVRGVSSIRDISLLRVQGSGMVGVTGFSSRLFGCLARKRVNVILITQASSEFSICFAVVPKDAMIAATAIKEEFEREIADGAIEPPAIEKDLSIIAVVGSRMKHTPGIAGKVFHSLGRNGVNIVAIAQGSSELNISAVIPRPDESKALNAVHEAFFLSGVRSVNLFLVGTGLIGGTLLDQISRPQDQDQSGRPGEFQADDLRQGRDRAYKVERGARRRRAFRRSGFHPAYARIQLAQQRFLRLHGERAGSRPLRGDPRRPRPDRDPEQAGQRGQLCALPFLSGFFAGKGRSVPVRDDRLRGAAGHFHPARPHAVRRYRPPDRGGAFRYPELHFQ